MRLIKSCMTYANRIGVVAMTSGRRALSRSSNGGPVVIDGNTLIGHHGQTKVTKQSFLCFLWTKLLAALL